MFQRRQQQKEADMLSDMANLSQAFGAGGVGGAPPPPPPPPHGGPSSSNKMAGAEQLVLELSNPDLRENALLELSKVNLILSTFLIIRELNFTGKLDSH